jgi:hypothetical protein
MNISIRKGLGKERQYVLPSRTARRRQCLSLPSKKGTDLNDEAVASLTRLGGL